MSKNEGSFPVVKCFEKNGQYFFWCPFCKTWHSHGAGVGHRSAHCAPAKVKLSNGELAAESTDSPFVRTGYIVKPFSKAELRQMGLVPIAEAEFWKQKYLALNAQKNLEAPCFLQIKGGIK